MTTETAAVARMTVAMKKAWVLSKLDASPRNVELAILAIYRRQTASEQATGTTREENGVGFTGTDAEFGSSLARAIEKYGKLTDKQAVYAAKIIRKYWKQLIAVAEAKGTMPGSVKAPVNVAPVAVVSAPVQVAFLDLAAVECKDPEFHDGEECNCAKLVAQGWTYCNEFTPGGAGWRRQTPEV